MRSVSKNRARRQSACAGLNLADKVAHFRRLDFTNSVHILFTYCPYRPASGLRVETDSISDKEKSELNFCFALKKILTKNSCRRSPTTKNLHAVETLTAPPVSRMICPPCVKFSCPFRPIARALLFCALLFLLQTSPRVSAADDPLVPPFGFRWTDSMPKV